MENQTLLSACLALTAAAVALQAGILVALYLAVRKSSARMEALATEVKTKLLPTAETVHSMLTDLRPKIETLLTNASETDRKSTRLNSSHSQISYAVFCLKKKNSRDSEIHRTHNRAERVVSYLY